MIIIKSVIININIGTTMNFHGSARIGSIIINKTVWNSNITSPIIYTDGGIGNIVNFFLYDFSYLANLNLDQYGTQVIGLLIGIVLMSLGVSLMMSVKLVVLPYDAFIVVFSDHFKLPFVKVRTGADFIFVLSSLFMAWAFTLSYMPVREGTVIFAFTVGSLIAYFSKFWRKILKLH